MTVRQHSFVSAWGQRALLAAGFFSLGSCGSEPNDSASSPAPAPAATPTSSSARDPEPGSTSPSRTSAADAAGVGSATDSSDAGSSVGAAPVRGASDATCNSLGQIDACGSCACQQCPDALERCANTPGCADILTCVAAAGCTGRDCYCGNASALRCAAGEGDGPCKEVVLAAPGGREPTLEGPSAGPASDAAESLGECLQANDACAQLCAAPGE